MPSKRTNCLYHAARDEIIHFYHDHNDIKIMNADQKDCIENKNIEKC